MDKIDRTLEAIERTRQKMIEASEQYGLSSKEVLKISQELDILLNNYQNSKESKVWVSFR
ncbi:Spo0E family sporulation regulatory protein-aspartic acid phosphatase [Paenibacillus sp. 2TAB26]|uniref:Spo0E family sporulation regulatory protein-aspartic acid phosphatase n=1 Tax=Paenibacillus sp. 2TAB26 TaxID=3233005 RepID=UPI003F9785E8